MGMKDDLLSESILDAITRDAERLGMSRHNGTGKSCILVANGATLIIIERLIADRETLVELLRPRRSGDGANQDEHR